MKRKGNDSMKRKILLGLLLSAGLWMEAGNMSLAADISVDEAHFPDAAFRSYVFEKIDSNHDGQLSEEEIASVTVITFEEGDAEGCESLEGIKYFTNLDALHCSNRELKTLDVSGMDKITILDCSDNQLTELNLEGVNNIVNLYCYNNHLTSLNVENSEGAMILNCMNNQLTELKWQEDFYQVTCCNNELRSLDSPGSAQYVDACFNYITEPKGKIGSSIDKSLDEAGIIICKYSPRKTYTFVINSDTKSLPKELFGYNLELRNGGILTQVSVFDNLDSLSPHKIKGTEGVYYSEEDGCVYFDEFSGNTLHASMTVEGNDENSDIIIPVDIKRVPFADVNTGDWYAESAAFVNERGIMTGMNDTEFGPGVKLSRAQFATILYRMEGEPEVAYDPAAFPDVREGQFYTAPAMWAKSTGVISGYEDGRFGPADEITREQMAVMMYRYANMRGLDISSEGDMSGFPDAGQVSAFADKEVKWAVGAGLIKGDGGNVNPQGTAERAQCATIIMRFMEGYGL